MKDLLSLFSRPSHYLGTEVNSVHKDLSTVRAHVALAFPDLYEVGMSYLGQKILYDIVNAHPRFYAERVFAPTEDVAEVLRSHDTPLASLESDTPLARLDAVLFSLTHELCYTNVLYMLDLAGIAWRTQHRGSSDPLIIAGGGCTFNAEPMAPFFDAMVLGDGEEILPEILEVIVQGKDEGWTRGQVLKALSALPGVYIPSFYTSNHLDQAEFGAGPKVEKCLVTDMNQVLFPTHQVVPFGKPVHDRFSVEIARGCTRGCRFCQAGMIYRPVRERSVSNLAEIIANGLAATGSEELSFLSLSTGDFSTLEALFLSSYDQCRAEQVSISLPSLRVGSVSAELMTLMGSIRRTGLTLAPEAGTQRLRDVINKGVTEAELLEHTATAFALGWQQIKLYFMIGLPTETTKDLDGILDLCLKVAASAGSGAKRLQISAAISPFVPKPHTPFQWERQLSMAEVEERILYLREIFRPYRRLKLKWHHSHLSFLEGVFSRGDRALAPAIEAACAKGALFASWSDHLRLEPWLEAFDEAGIDGNSYLAARDKNQRLPWDHLDSGVRRKFLLIERDRALSEKITPDCRYATCRSCGVCTVGKRTSELSLQASSQEILPILNQDSRDQAEPAPRASLPEASTNLHQREQRLRLWYSKIGPAIYLSQLELQRIFERAFRRAKIPLSFSAGFHPAPLVSFGRALPVGVGSVCEWLDFFVREQMSPQSVPDLLGPELPQGMRPLRVDILPNQRRTLATVRERFHLAWRHSHKQQEFVAKLDVFLDATQWLVSKLTKKGEPIEVDIRPLVLGGEMKNAGVEIELDWSQTYISPIFVLQAIKPDFSLLDANVTKVAQYFEVKK